MTPIELPIIIASIIATFLVVSPALIVWRAHTLEYQQSGDLIVSTIAWIFTIGAAVGLLVTLIEWSNHFLLNAAGVVLILIGVGHLIGLMTMFAKYSDDTDRRKYANHPRQSVGS